MPSLSWLRGGSRGKLVNPLVDPVVVLPVSDIVEEGVGGVEVRRDLRCIQDNLFPLIDCFLVIDKLLGYLNGLNKVELAGLHYNVDIVFTQDLMQICHVYVLKFSFGDCLGLHASVYIFYKDFFSSKDLAM